MHMGGHLGVLKEYELHKIGKTFVTYGKRILSYSEFAQTRIFVSRMFMKW